MVLDADLVLLSTQLIEDLHEPFDVHRRKEIAFSYLTQAVNLVDIPKELPQEVTFDDLLAATYTILGEARAESFNGQVAVANVIVNRWKRPGYFKERNIYGVCHAPLQFSMWNNSPDKNLEIVMNIPMHDKRFLKALAAITLVLSGELNDNTQGADHYHTIKKPGYASTWPPNWGKTELRTVDIENHRFYKLAHK